MRKFHLNCSFGNQTAPVSIFIGEAKSGSHPLKFQSEFLSKERGGIIPVEVMENVMKLKALADNNEVNLEDLCVYVLGVAKKNIKESDEKL